MESVADGDEQDVDGARHVLAAAAVGALGEVLVVVRAHGGREAGDVIAPAGEDVADDGSVQWCGHAVSTCGDWMAELSIGV